jgi:hypothetical protein
LNGKSTDPRSPTVKPSPERPRHIPLIESARCKEEHIILRERWIRSRKKVPTSAKILLANAQILSRVPVSQIVFYLGCTEAEVARWTKASHRRVPMGWTKWRHELNLYEIAHIDFGKIP